MVLVTVVPIFAPMIMGTAVLTWTSPEATRPTINDVVTEEDCTRVVARMPTSSPSTGFMSALM